MNLVELLASLSDLDNVPDITINPLDIVGEITDKVDAIKKVLGRLDKEAERLEEAAAEFHLAATRTNANANSLREWVRFAMESQGFDKLPGKHYRLQLQENVPSLKVDREATPEDALADPEVVQRTVTYRWKKDVIKDRLKTGGTFLFGRLARSKSIRFYVNKAP